MPLLSDDPRVCSPTIPNFPYPSPNTIAIQQNEMLNPLRRKLALLYPLYTVYSHTKTERKATKKLFHQCYIKMFNFFIIVISLK
jgi:hypothetical protein